MITYIFIAFLPGSAGNFFSRCINLASEQCYGWVPNNKNKINLSLEDKFNSFQYEDRCEDWNEFESRLQHYSKIMPHYEIPDGSISMWGGHPYCDIFSKVSSLAGPDNKKYIFYIDSSKNFEWTVLNCLYKNSVITSRWMIAGKKMLDDDNVIKVNLDDIINSKDTLIDCVEKVCKTVNIVLENKNKEKIKNLWDQWIVTTLPKSEFETFKNKIGYYNT